MRSSKSTHIDFSIIIPTYNRSKYVGSAIKSVLKQKKVNLEIIVCDDCSSDSTQQEVKKYSDKRLRYIRNKQRIGISLNFQKCFLAAKGDYIFTLGDDDLILDENTLYEILKVMKKEKVGLGKIGTISYDKSILFPYQAFILSDHILLFRPINQEHILAKTVNLGIGFFSGLIFNNRLIDRHKLKFDHKCFIEHMCHTYNKAALDLIYRYGAIYIPHKFIISHLSINLVPRYFNLKQHGRLFIEDPLNQAKQLVSEAEYDVFKKALVRNHIPLLPSIKYFTNTSNYISVVKKFIELDRSLIVDPAFIFWGIIGMLPKNIIKLFRDFKIFISRRKINKILEKYNYYSKIQNL